MPLIKTMEVFLHFDGCYGRGPPGQAKGGAPGSMGGAEHSFIVNNLCRFFPLCFLFFQLIFS